MDGHPIHPSVSVPSQSSASSSPQRSLGIPYGSGILCSSDVMIDAAHSVIETSMCRVAYRAGSESPDGGDVAVGTGADGSLDMPAGAGRKTSSLRVSECAYNVLRQTGIRPYPGWSVPLDEKGVSPRHDGHVCMCSSARTEGTRPDTATSVWREARSTLFNSILV